VNAHNDWQRMVMEFHEKLSQPVGERPKLLRPDRYLVRRKWERSEDKEDMEAQYAQDLAGAADAIVDEIYFRIGRAVEMGIELDPLFRAVHTANLAKVGGETHSDGKIAKPPGWTAPDVAAELRKQGWEGK
jgi:predicted HAD superfamily Cof-like phosphohydrolase